MDPDPFVARVEQQLLDLDERLFELQRGASQSEGARRRGLQLILERAQEDQGQLRELLDQLRTGDAAKDGEVRRRIQETSDRLSHRLGEARRIPADGPG